MTCGNVFGYTRGQQALFRMDLLIGVNGVARFVVVLALSRDLRVGAPGVSVVLLTSRPQANTVVRGRQIKDPWCTGDLEALAGVMNRSCGSGTWWKDVAYPPA